MKKIKERIAAKLGSGAGESLAEVLIALLIAALALTMLASVISTTSRIITQTKAKMETYYQKNDEVAAQVGTPTNKLNLTITVKSWKGKLKEATAYGENNDEHPVASSSYTTHLASGDTEVYYFVNDTLQNTKVISYKKK